MTVVDAPVTSPAPVELVEEATRRPWIPPLATRLRIPPPKGRPAPWAVTVTWVMRVLAGLAVWLLLFGFVLSPLQEGRAQAVLYTHMREQLAEATVPVGAPIKTGAPVALLSAPVIGMKDLVVVEGTSSQVLRNGPGHLRSTVLPGQAGYSVIYGKSATYGGPFSEIQRLQPGDLIAVTTGEGQFSYKVDDVRVAGDPVPPAVAAGGSRLTLKTSTGGSWRSGFAPGHTLTVDATLTGQVAGGGTPVPAAAHELAMSSDTGGLTTLVLWLEALVLAAIAITWMSARWGRWQTWTVGSLVLLLVLWGATDCAARLLPNLV